MAVMTIGPINVGGDVASVISNIPPDNEVIEDEPNGIIDFSQAGITPFTLDRASGAGQATAPPDFLKINKYIQCLQLLS